MSCTSTAVYYQHLSFHSCTSVSVDYIQHCVCEQPGFTLVHICFFFSHSQICHTPHWCLAIVRSQTMCSLFPQPTCWWKWLTFSSQMGTLSKQCALSKPLSWTQNWGLTASWNEKWCTNFTCWDIFEHTAERVQVWQGVWPTTGNALCRKHMWCVCDYVCCKVTI